LMVASWSISEQKYPQKNQAHLHYMCMMPLMSSYFEIDFRIGHLSRRRHTHLSSLACVLTINGLFYLKKTYSNSYLSKKRIHRN
jgi:hypothetical protein